METVFAGNGELLIRLVVAMVLGGLVGFEREIAGKVAGFRTYSLISVGAALFVIISSVVSKEFIGVTVFDPLRVASQVVVGIGFLGAGLIIFRGDTVHGVTTAAGLWIVTALGMAVGFGMYEVAIFATILALIIFTGMWYVENRFKRWFEEHEEHNDAQHENVL